MGLDHAPDRPTTASSGATECTKIAEDLNAVASIEPAATGMDGDRCDEVEQETCNQVRKPMPVDPVDPLDVLFPHERSPDASQTHKRSASAALGDDDGHRALLEHPCDKKLRRDDHAGTTVAEALLARRQRLSSATTTESRRLLSPLDVADAEQIRQHLRDVRREVFLRPMIAIVTRLMFHKYNHGLFNVRVDPVEWKIPHYFEIVKKPMDLALVKTKCLNLEYASVEECVADIKLVFSNACLFNPPGHVVHECAELLAKEFDAEYTRYQGKKAMQDKRREEHCCPSCLANVCGICNEKCINFEPPLVMCSGSCKQRIKRHAVYYTTQDRLFFWCAKCYTTLPKVVNLSPVAHGREEAKLSKQALVKAKFVDELTEPWVQCDLCEGWVHQICALFNSCENAEEVEDLPYACPLCRLHQLEQDHSMWKLLERLPSETSVDEFPIKVHRDLLATVGSHSPIVKQKPLAKDFTRVLGFGIEAQQKVLDYLHAEDVEAFEMSVCETTGACRRSSQLLSTPLSTFMQNWTRQFLVEIGEPEVADSIVIKVASSIKSQGVVISPIVRQHFQSPTQKYPETMEYTSKAIFVFQKIEGVEVCIFSMYVQEYDGTAAVVANRNRTYIAYIDSLVYMRPRHVRTKLFHEILISYLAYCKGKGFEYAHIWACPTTRGGDFIYWCHPSFQKNPGKDRLLQWYLAMVEKAKTAGVVFACEDLYATNFDNLEVNLEQQLPPYFDGDYWVAEVERLHANPPKRGKLSKEKYEESLRGEKFRKKLVESVRLSRESLFVIALQPKCSTCNELVVNSSYWKIDDGRLFVCNACKATGAVDAEKVEPPQFVKSCEEVDEEGVNCPFVDYRADMLKNCEEHHYQFDSFRRAKYSTMMLIYHIASTQRALKN